MTPVSKGPKFLPFKDARIFYNKNRDAVEITGKSDDFSSGILLTVPSGSAFDVQARTAFKEKGIIETVENKLDKVPGSVSVSYLKTSVAPKPSIFPQIDRVVLPENHEGKVIALSQTKSGVGQKTVAKLLGASIRKESLEAYNRGDIERPLNVIYVNYESEGKIQNLRDNLSPGILDSLIEVDIDNHSFSEIEERITYSDSLDIHTYHASYEVRENEFALTSYIMHSLKKYYDVVIVDNFDKSKRVDERKVVNGIADINLIVTDAELNSLRNVKLVQRSLMKDFLAAGSRQAEVEVPDKGDDENATWEEAKAAIQKMHDKRDAMAKEFADKKAENVFILLNKFNDKLGIPENEISESLQLRILHTIYSSNIFEKYVSRVGYLQLDKKMLSNPSDPVFQENYKEFTHKVINTLGLSLGETGEDFDTAGITYTPRESDEALPFGHIAIGVDADMNNLVISPSGFGDESFFEHGMIIGPLGDQRGAINALSNIYQAFSKPDLRTNHRETNFLYYGFTEENGKLVVTETDSFSRLRLLEEFRKFEDNTSNPQIQKVIFLDVDSLVEQSNIETSRSRVEKAVRAELLEKIQLLSGRLDIHFVFSSESPTEQYNAFLQVAKYVLCFGGKVMNKETNAFLKKVFHPHHDEISKIDDVSWVPGRAYGFFSRWNPAGSENHFHGMFQSFELVP